MYSVSRFSLSLVIVCFGTFLMLQVTAKTTASSSKLKIKSPEIPLAGPSENVFYRLAKSMAVEAINEFKESSRRNPKLGFNMTLPIMLPGVGNGTTNGSLTDLAGLAGIPVTIGVSALTLKSAIIGGLAAVKAAIIQIIITIFWLLFLISGTVYFVCNAGLFSCGNALGGLGNIGGGGPSLGSGSSGGGNPLSFLNSRSGLADHYDRQTQPVYKALDDGYKKYQ